MRIVVVVLLLLIVLSLGSALLFLVRDRGSRTRVVRALAIRVGLSILLFMLLMAGFATGVITQRL